MSATENIARFLETRVFRSVKVRRSILEEIRDLAAEEVRKLGGPVQGQQAPAPATPSKASVTQDGQIKGKATVQPSTKKTTRRAVTTSQAAAPVFVSSDDPMPMTSRGRRPGFASKKEHHWPHMRDKVLEAVAAISPNEAATYSAITTYLRKDPVARGSGSDRNFKSSVAGYLYRLTKSGELVRHSVDKNRGDVFERKVVGWRLAPQDTQAATVTEERGLFD